MAGRQTSLKEFFSKEGTSKKAIKRALSFTPPANGTPEKKRANVCPPPTHLGGEASSSSATSIQQESPIKSHQPRSEESLDEGNPTGTGLAEEKQEIQDGWPNPELSFLFSTLVEPNWRLMLTAELKKDYVKKICQFLEQQHNKATLVFPPHNLIFNAFNLTPFNQIRVVLLGQDPYHNLRQAHGLCFSVPRDVPPPPSLKNIYKELASEYPGFVPPKHGLLVSWAKQGVFLLNATLTVEAHKANSHSHIGWQDFTDSVIRLISEKSTKGVVFLLWGGFAQRKEALVDKRKHRVIKAAHPSPLSVVKFFGCKCFSKTNDQLKELGQQPINWTDLD